MGAITGPIMAAGMYSPPIIWIISGHAD
jgi:carbon starvation protein CstA